VEREGEFSVTELEARLYRIGMSASGWLETLEMGQKVRFPSLLELRTSLLGINRKKQFECVRKLES
jgi:hypothetical protein